MQFLSIYQHLRIGDKIPARLALVATSPLITSEQAQSPTEVFTLWNQRISYFHIRITELLDVWRPEKWVSWDLNYFSEGKCKDLQLGRNNPMHRLSVNWLESRFAQHRWEHIWNAWWSSRALQLKQRATKTIEGLQHLMDVKRLRELVLFSLRKKQAQEDQMPERESKKYNQTLLKGAQRQDKRQSVQTEIWELLSGQAARTGLQNNSLTTHQNKTKFFFEYSVTLNQVAQRWCSFPPWRHSKPGWILS